MISLYLYSHSVEDACYPLVLHNFGVTLAFNKGVADGVGANEMAGVEVIHHSRTSAEIYGGEFCV